MEYEYILEKAYGVAHLPSDKVAEGYQYITTLVDNLRQGNGVTDDLLLKLQSFTAYLRRYWQPLAPILSVYQRPIRTNNTCENFHLYAARKMGVRSNIFKMLGKNMILYSKLNLL